jgi:hypothetical protein
MSNDWFTDDKQEEKFEQKQDGISGWGDDDNNGYKDDKFEKETVSEWADDNGDKETISEWLVDEEQPHQEELKVENFEEVSNRNTFYDVYKFEINSIFDGPKLFHQEHVKKTRERVDDDFKEEM